MDISKLVRRYFREIGLTSDHARAISSRINKVLESKGTVGSLEYFKRVSQGILWSRRGLGEKPKFVAFRKGHPSLVEELRFYTDIQAVRVSTFFRSITFDSITPKQLSKAVNGVLEPYTGSTSGYYRALSLIKDGAAYYGYNTLSTPDPSGPGIVGTQFRRIQSVSKPTESVSEPPIVESLQLLAGNETLRKLPYWQEAFWPIYPKECDRLMTEVEPLPTFVGEIHAAQEGGGKLRMYAAPYTIHQILLRPIHNWIKRFRDPLPTDCTYDQLSGATWAISKFAIGTCLHSVDLSTATCRFPLDLQLDMLEFLGLPLEYREVFQWSAKSSWKVDPKLVDQGFPEVMSWNVGQPLGITPSMSAFSLAHNLLITGLCLETGARPADTFRVLGDDVLISDDAIATAYKRVISDLGIPISLDKTYSSEEYAEFAGARIFHDDWVRPGQWREPSALNALGLAEGWSRPTPHLFSSKWATVQQVHLFAQGIGELHDLSVQEYSMLLKANSLHKAISSKDWFMYQYPKGMSRHEGIVKIIRRDLTHRRVKCQHPDVSYSDVWKEALKLSLPSEDLDYIRMWKHNTEQLSDPSLLTNHWNCLTALSSLWERGRLDTGLFFKTLEKTTEACCTYLWLPPKSETKMASQLFNSYLKVVTNIGNETAKGIA